MAAILPFVYFRRVLVLGFFISGREIFPLASVERLEVPCLRYGSAPSDRSGVGVGAQGPRVFALPGSLVKAKFLLAVLVRQARKNLRVSSLKGPVRGQIHMRYHASYLPKPIWGIRSTPTAFLRITSCWSYFFEKFPFQDG